jgi:hypothetical protein
MSGETWGPELPEGVFIESVVWQGDQLMYTLKVHKKSAVHDAILDGRWKLEINE